MKIAQVAPLYERVPPISYGGTERIVSYLTEELVAAGHDVTLFASGDSHTTARLGPRRLYRYEAGERDDHRCSAAHRADVSDRISLRCVRAAIHVGADDEQLRVDLPA